MNRPKRKPDIGEDAVESALPVVPQADDPIPWDLVIIVFFLSCLLCYVF